MNNDMCEAMVTSIKIQLKKELKKSFKTINVNV